jgi:DNA-binding NtrC family response regulator
LEQVKARCDRTDDTCLTLLRVSQRFSLDPSPARELLKRLRMSLSQSNVSPLAGLRSSSSVDVSPVRCGPRIATLYEAEWLHILATRSECGGNVSRAARALGLARQSLQRKLRRLPPLSMNPSANSNVAL